MERVRSLAQWCWDHVTIGAERFEDERFEFGARRDVDAGKIGRVFVHADDQLAVWTEHLEAACECAIDPIAIGETMTDDSVEDHDVEARRLEMLRHIFDAVDDMRASAPRGGFGIRIDSGVRANAL